MFSLHERPSFNPLSRSDLELFDLKSFDSKVLNTMHSKLDGRLRASFFVLKDPVRFGDFSKFEITSNFLLKH